MAFAKQITTCRIVANSVNHDLELQNMTFDFKPEFFGEKNKRALSGKLIQRFAGYRGIANLTYDASLDADDWRTFLNNLYIHFVTNNNDSIDFYPDQTKITASDKIAMILDDVSYQSLYQNQIGYFVPSLNLIALNRTTSISSNFEGV